MPLVLSNFTSNLRVSPKSTSDTFHDSSIDPVDSIAWFFGSMISAGVTFGTSAPTSANLFFSEAAEGSSNHKYLEVYNASGSDVALDECFAFPNVSNAPSTPGEYENWNTFDAGATVAAGDVYVICHGSSDAAILAECDQYHTYLSNGDDGFCLISGTQNDFTLLRSVRTTIHGDFLNIL